MPGSDHGAGGASQSKSSYPIVPNYSFPSRASLSLSPPLSISFARLLADLAPKLNGSLPVPTVAWIRPFRPDDDDANVNAPLSARQRIVRRVRALPDGECIVVDGVRIRGGISTVSRHPCVFPSLHTNAHTYVNLSMVAGDGVCVCVCTGVQSYSPLSLRFSFSLSLYLGSQALPIERETV